MIISDFTSVATTFNRFNSKSLEPEQEMALYMKKPERIMQKQQESIAMLFEKLLVNMSIKTEPSNPSEPKYLSESLIL